MLIIYLCEFLSMNSQLNLGYGMTGDDVNGLVAQDAKAGATSILGDKCGKVDFTESGQLSNGACHVSLFGVEDPYGFFWEYVQGVYFGSSENEGQDGTECYIYEGNRLPTNEELKGTPTGIYRKITRTTSYGWVKKLMWGANLDIFPATLGGNSIDGYGDYHFANTKGQVLWFGGSTNNGLQCGFALSRSNEVWSSKYSGVGARLAYYGNAEIV